MNRQPAYHSPSSLGLWIKDRREYYLKYLCPTRVPRYPQTQPMSIGSAFDSYVKNYIAAVLGCCGDAHIDPAKSAYFDTLFTSSVEEQNRGTAIVDGLHCFNEYVNSGALSTLMTMIPSGSTIRMEDTVRGTVSGVPLLGKPDLLIEYGGLRVILDWKVNGFYSSASPVPGYIDRYGAARGAHCDVFPVRGPSGIIVGSPLSDEWYRQLITYDWCLGGTGLASVFLIDQLCWRNKKLTVARHSGTAGALVVEGLRLAYIGMNEAITSGRCFTDLAVDLDIRMQAGHAAFAAGLGGESASDALFRSMCHNAPRY